MTDYFQLSQTNPKYHLHALCHDRASYLRQLKALRTDGGWSGLSSSLKGTVMAALWMGKCQGLVANVLAKEACGIKDIATTLSILDNPRQKRQLAKKIANIERQCPHVIVPFDDDNDKDQDEKKSKRTRDKGGNEKPKRKRPRQVDRLRKELHSKEADEKNRYNDGDGSWNNDSAVQELYDSASASGALARHIRRWAGTLKTDFLEFVMLEIEDKTHWKFVADLVHFSPKDFSLPYFLADVHGESIPDDCFVSAIRKLLAFESKDECEFAELFEAMAEKFPQIYLSYPSLRLKPTIFRNPAIVENLARHIPMETVIWYFEEMYQTSTECASILKARLGKPGALQEAMASGDKVYFFGKLMERILMFQKMGKPELADSVTPIAVSTLSALREKWSSRGHDSNKKLAVLGDASSSMQCAIEAATIFAGFLPALLDGELIFFNHEAVRSPHKKPSTVPQVLDICNKIRASGATSLASALGNYTKNGTWLDAVVLVTDEEENTAWNGRFFAQLFKEYRESTNPNAKLVVVCVGSGDYQFRQSLTANGIEHSTVHVDAHRPDLTKFDALVGDIAHNCLGLALGGGDNVSEEKMDVEKETVGMDDDFVVVE